MAKVRERKGLPRVRVDDPLRQRRPRDLRRPDHGLAFALHALGPGVPRVYPVVGALGTALVGFNVLALVVILVPFKRHERWAWYALWMLPLQWILQFVFFPDLAYLTLAMLITVGLLLPYRRFFSSMEEPTRVK